MPSSDSINFSLPNIPLPESGTFLMESAALCSQRPHDIKRTNLEACAKRKVNSSCQAKLGEGGSCSVFLYSIRATDCPSIKSGTRTLALFVITSLLTTFIMMPNIRFANLVGSAE